jgi:hypothetical protein
MSDTFRAELILFKAISNISTVYKVKKNTGMKTKL